MIPVLLSAINLVLHYLFSDFSCVTWGPYSHQIAASYSKINSSHTTVRQKPLPCLRNAFKDILLVIVYNYPYYKSIKHFKDLYKPVFPSMVFCGPPDKTAGDSVMSVNIYRGVLGYECLGRAIRQHPGFQGYFYINDDVILNYWNFYDFDRNKIWQSPNVFGSTPMYGEIKDPWYWWRSPYGLPNCRQAYEHLTNISLGHEDFSLLRENSNGSLRCFSGRSDVLYIPKRHAQAFSVLSFIFYTHKVFLEIAVPTMLRVLDKATNIKNLPGYYIPGDVRKGDKRVTDSRFFWFIYLTKKDNWFIHPFKLQHEKLDSNFNFIMLRYFLIEKTRELTTCTWHKSIKPMSSNSRTNQTAIKGS